MSNLKNHINCNITIFDISENIIRLTFNYNVQLNRNAFSFLFQVTDFHGITGWHRE